MKKDKIWKSKKKLVAKLKKEKHMYEKKHAVLVKQIEAIGAIPSAITAYTRYIREINKKIIHIENSGAYKFAKNNATNRKGGR